MGRRLWSYGSWIYNYLCNQCLLPLMLRVRISIRARCTTLCDICLWLATCRWFSPGPPVSSTNKTDRHDKAEILLKVVLNTIKQLTNKQFVLYFRNKQQYLTTYLPWAIRCGRNANFLMAVYWEKHWEKNLDELRAELNIEPAPKLEKYK